MNKWILNTITYSKTPSFNLRIAAIVVLAAFVPFGALGEQRLSRTGAIKPEPELQTQIKRTLNAPSQQELENQLARLRQLGGDEYEKLIPQLLYYSMHGKCIVTPAAFRRP